MTRSSEPSLCQPGRYDLLLPNFARMDQRSLTRFRTTRRGSEQVISQPCRRQIPAQRHAVTVVFFLGWGADALARMGAEALLARKSDSVACSASHRQSGHRNCRQARVSGPAPCM
jgi:hypothetical protein